MPQTKYISWIPAPNTIKRIDKIHTFLYAWTNGIIGSRLDGMDVLLLTTIGKKTGLPRTIPLPYFRDGSRYLLVASFGGNAKNPKWVANLLSHPEVRVQCGRKRWSTQAHVAQGEERDRLWSGITYDFPRYAVYQTKTDRQIPVIVIDGPQP